VSSALSESEKNSKVDIVQESTSRSALDKLRKVIEEGRALHSVAGSRILMMASETQRKLTHQLNELNHMAEKARLESRIFNQYKELVDRSREQFAVELRSVLPGIDVNAKENKLTDEEKNALIAHAHLRVDQLKRQLIEHQVQEEHKIAQAIEAQRLADSKIAEEQLDLELRRFRDNLDTDVEKKVLEERAMWETELQARLNRASLAHADHLESVIRTQKQLHDIENAKLVTDAVERERNLHKKQIELSLAKLGGIEEALSGKVVADAENRRAKQYWIACQNLSESIVYGRKSGSDLLARRKPLSNELHVIKEACENDGFVQSLINCFPQSALENGVYTEMDLKQRFHKLYKLARRTVKIDENGGGSIGKYISSYLQSFLMVELPLRKFSVDEQIDVNKLDAYEILSRAKYFADNGNFAATIRLIGLLRGEPARLAQDWINDARTHEEVKFLAELLIAHAAVTNIRSIY